MSLKRACDGDIYPTSQNITWDARPAQGGTDECRDVHPSAFFFDLRCHVTVQRGWFIIPNAIHIRGPLLVARVIMIHASASDASSKSRKLFVDAVFVNYRCVDSASYLSCCATPCIALHCMPPLVVARRSILTIAVD